jgi:hypothetical protein
MGSIVGNRRLTTFDNALDHNKRGINQAKTCTTTTVTGSLLQKSVTVAAGNQGSCDKNPGQAVHTDETGAIVGENGGHKKEVWIDPQAMAQEAAGVSIRMAALRPQKKLKI